MHRHKLFTDGALLYFAHIFRYVFPIVIIPLLARKLGAEHYGIVLVGLSLATLVSLIVEFGFNVSGTRTWRRRMRRNWMVSFRRSSPPS